MIKISSSLPSGIAVEVEGLGAVWSMPVAPVNGAAGFPTALVPGKANFPGGIVAGDGDCTVARIADVANVLAGLEPDVPTTCLDLHAAE
jgi:hypothetical protein